MYCSMSERVPGAVWAEPEVLSCAAASAAPPAGGVGEVLKVGGTKRGVLQPGAKEGC